MERASGTRAFDIAIFRGRRPRCLLGRSADMLRLCPDHFRKVSGRKPYAASDIKLLRQRSEATAPVSKISKLMKRSVGSLRQKALKLGIGLGHER
jgi:hypothetical protein